ncbi:hypothetical protein O4H49_19125 [Kiloniella laminariae]|uniref:Zinc-finger domain-containing protein n=1 Tax=Kiloniella laminariae TaxID=454162 RepID=A0ABT4LPE3_9PROT|nr:hypothetical protein [Kiloniella laminariae]MCZ4282906.1 hypothetical protein [Kiloniella laminariae]
MTGIISGSATQEDVVAVEVPRFHPSGENLIDYVSGSIEPGLEFFITSHLSLCSDCREEIVRLQALGGALLERLPLGDLPEGMEERMMDLLDSEQDSAEITPFPRGRSGGKEQLPAPVSQILSDNLEDLEWKDHETEGRSTVALPLQPARIFLLKVDSGKVAFSGKMTRQTGLVLVLSGALESEQEQLCPGDIRTLADMGEEFYAGSSTALAYCLVLLGQEDICQENLG